MCCTTVSSRVTHETHACYHGRDAARVTAEQLLPGMRGGLGGSGVSPLQRGVEVGGV